MYTFIYEHLSNESLDAIKLVKDYSEFHSAKDPALLWLGTMGTHKVPSTSTVPSVLKVYSRAKYQAIYQNRAVRHGTGKLQRQGGRSRFAMDYMRGLDNAICSEFKANLLNDLPVPGTKAPETCIRELRHTSCRGMFHAMENE